MNDFPEAGRGDVGPAAEASQTKEKGKGGRRKSRVAAMQALFFMETNPSYPLEQALTLFSENFPVPEHSRTYFLHLVRGTWEKKTAIDRLIRRCTEHWRLERMSPVDRNILRIGVFELVFNPDIPPRVAINEAIDLGKRFGSEDSGAFINGILDRVFLEHSGKSDSRKGKEEK